MGFCRRCGDIVTGERCSKCGGMAVAPVVPWNQTNPKEKTQDRWSKTYVQDRSTSPTRPTIAAPTTAPPAATAPASVALTNSSPTKRFPRPLSQSSAPPLGNRVSAHITSTTSQLNRPPSPLKYSSLAAPESGILPSLHDTSTLAKVYGSVLQPRESLTVQCCAQCATPYGANSTIYPDPYGSTSTGPPRFFCRSCFITNGGSRGTCAACARPVLILKSEGGFIHAADQYWHKQCFDCAGCDKNIGDAPMVDLLGRPCCPDCFDNCLERDATPKKKSRNSTSSPRVDNLGGMGSGRKSRSREGSPALEELEQRLGIVKTREASPALEELSHRLSMIGKESPTKSPRLSAYSGSPSMTTSASRYSTSSREGSPLVGRSRGKSDPLADLNVSSSSRRYERFRSPESEERTNSPSMRYSSGSPSPVRSPVRHSASPGPTEEAIEEMKRRFMKGSSASPSTSLPSTPPLAKPRLRSSRSSGRLSSPSIPPTPDLMSDFSDTTSSSGPDSPPRDSGSVYDVDVFSASKVFAPGYGSRYTREFVGNVDDVITEETKSQMGTPTHTPKSTVKAKATPTKSPIPFANTSQSKSPRNLAIVPPKPTASSSCIKCHRALFAVEEGGRYVTVPNDITGEPETYHADCFTCVSCDLPFKEGAAGQAVFVKGERGPCHVECAPPQKISIRPIPSSSATMPIFPKAAPAPSTRQPGVTPTATFASSSKYDRPPHTAPATSTPSSFPRFGTTNSCPGCHKSVSPMEPGVVPGPHGTRWHATCLVCGGKKTNVKPWAAREEKKKGVPGCGKKLDSAAKGDGEGGVWCRECSLLLPIGMRGSPQGSPTRSALTPSYTGTAKVAPQFTGTTIARQFTGYGSGGDPGIFRQMTGGGASPTRSVSPTKGLGYGGDPGIFRQMTGGGLSPTRSISPTKGMGGAYLRPRPKSVVGIRNTNIVRQMTGSGV
ncbi:hypothetical protein B0H17DRAFT_1192587 [Mycena rosella]|uniref:LIM zinc-binding domain-containing protein n=1 Tax=Mycena rosella TaxID=1033263 RepID=A0AAD7M8S9_MYCRO|nr:hypothetical protein B0H17DRAFT_1192587 [Mycena rosella]